MEEVKIERTLVKVDEKYGHCLEDKCFGGNTKERKPEGFVEIYDILENGNKQLIGKSNLVLYQGREWLAERAFNTNNTNTTTTPSQFICWLGLGDGGCPPGDPLNPDSPTSLDTDLANEIPINPTDTNCTDWRVGESAFFKKPFDSIVFEQDAGNSNKWLISKVTITIASADSNGENINEAGLFVCASSAGGVGNVGPWAIAARCTFPTIVKTVARQLMFLWYIYF
jgi:hypothetical protein